jgi:hypothetical protein
VTPTRRRRTVLHGEALEAVIQELDEFTASEATRIKEARQASGSVADRQRKPDIGSALDATLRAVLEDEIVPAILPESTGKILSWEVHREVLKKALAALKTDALRAIARTRGLELGGGLEGLTTRIGEHYKWDDEAIVQLILEYSTEPSEERGHIDRLFTLEQAPDLDYVAERLDYVLGRYIRTGIAKWFVFEELDAQADRVVLRGTLRSFRAGVNEASDLPSVVAVPLRDHTVEVVVDQSVIVVVTGANATESAAAVEALRVAAKVQPVGHIVPRSAGAKPVSLSFAPQSLFMLDLLGVRFPQAGLHSRNLIVARFRIDEAGPADETRPRLRAVRFEGSHLLDSVAACKLMADEGRALVDVSFTTQPLVRRDGETAQFPVRVAIERGQVLVFTGFGVVPTLSFGLHSTVRSCVMAELTQGLADLEKVEALATRIQERARQPVAAEVADILSDDSPPA